MTILEEFEEEIRLSVETSRLGGPLGHSQRREFTIYASSRVPILRVEFSSSGKFLACVVNGNVVWFPLRKPRSSNRIVNELPLPHYLQGQESKEPEIPVASDPRVIEIEKASCLCPLEKHSFLVGTTDHGLHTVHPRFRIPQQFPLKHSIQSIEYKSNILAICDDKGSIHMYSFCCTDQTEEYLDKSSRSIETQANEWLMGTKQIHQFDGGKSFCIINASLIAVLYLQGSKVKVAVLDFQGVELVSLSLTKESLEEDAHTMFGTRDYVMKSEISDRKIFDITYNNKLACLTIRGELPLTECPLSFATIWNWRWNIQGLTMTGQTGSSDAFFGFAEDAVAGSQLVFMMWSGKSLRKETFGVSLLMPPSSNVHSSVVNRGGAGSMLLSARSVAYPVVQSSGAKDFELSWGESRIPTPYTIKHGCPTLACTGKKWGRSIAVASSKGVCVLDLGVRSTNDRQVRQHRPHWRMFGNQTEENSFQVEAMEWWEGPQELLSKKMIRDDLLLAIVRVGEDLDRARFLACWSIRMLDRRHQLLIPQFNGHGSYEWGIPIPDEVSSDQIQLEVLQNPNSVDVRKAVVLVSDPRAHIFCLFQLEVVENEHNGFTKSYAEKSPFSVKSKLSTVANAPRCSSLFLAGASFDFEQQNDEPLATLCAIRDTNFGVEAMVITPAGVSERGHIISASQASSGAEVSECSLIDVVEEYGHETTSSSLDFVWLFRLFNGRLLVWSVPSSCYFREGGARQLLGHTKPVGTVSTWMQHTSLGTQRLITMGSVPGSNFGARLCTGQGCRKLHRSLSQDFESELFADDFLRHEILCPEYLSLSPPLFLCSLYALLLDCATAVEANRDSEVPARQICKKLHSDPFKDAIGMVLELLALRCAESISESNTIGANRSKHRLVLGSLAEGVFHNFDEFQSAHILLSAARKIEPGYLHSLFPISAPQSIDAPNSPINSIHDLFRVFLKYGSVEAAVATLPLLADDSVFVESNAEIFEICLDRVYESLCAGNFCSSAESMMLSDIFRYGTKARAATEREAWDSDDDDSDPPHAGYSILCGVFSGRRQTNRIVSTKKSLENRNEKNVATVMSSFLLRFLSKQAAGKDWHIFVAICRLIQGEGVDGLPRCTAEEFSGKIESLGTSSVKRMLQNNRLDKTLKLSGLLSSLISEMEDHMTTSDADIVLAILLVVAALPVKNDDLPGLMILSVAAAHTCHRVDELMEDHLRDHGLWQAYLKSQTAEF